MPKTLRKGDICNGAPADGTLAEPLPAFSTHDVPVVALQDRAGCRSGEANGAVEDVLQGGGHLRRIWAAGCSQDERRLTGSGDDDDDRVGDYSEVREAVF